MATTNDLKNGLVLDLDGNLWTVIQFQHVKPGKGGAFVRTKLKSIMSGKVVERTFNAGVKVDVATVDRREMQYLYREGDDFVFMDTATYEQTHVAKATMGDDWRWLKDNTNCQVLFFNGRSIGITLPNFVELKVEHSEPGVRGDTSSGASKPATLETGATIQVPLFVTTGEKVKVDTRDGRYLGRS